MPEADPSTEGNPPAPTQADPAEKISKAVESLLAKHGDPNAALRTVLNENYGYRDQLRELKAKLPADGSLVLAPDDVKTLNSYRELGDPKDLRKELETLRGDSKELVGIRLERSYSSFAKDAGFKPEAFVKLAMADKLDLVAEEINGKDGKPVKTVFVKGEGDTKTPLADYVNKHWSTFLPALTESQEKKTVLGSPSRYSQPPAPPGPVATPPVRKPSPF